MIDHRANPCRRVGLDITWRCNWTCRHCFYRRNPAFHADRDVPLADIKAFVDRAADAGFDHAVMTGFGEPTLARHFLEVLMYCADKGLATSAITNGSTGVRRIENAFACGLDHVHLSAHEQGPALDRIACAKGAGAAQAELKAWLGANGYPYRANCSVQRENYTRLAQIVEAEIAAGVCHQILLGFLPHYEWRDHVADVAVHPAELRPFLEDAARRVLAADRFLTIRYHPLCHLDEDLWPYVTNARYVFFDPWEWNHTLNVSDRDRLWADAQALGGSVACETPCGACAAREHCGGWNRVYAAAFDGADLAPIAKPPAAYADDWDTPGSLFLRNPANWETGTIRASRPLALATGI